MRSRIGKKGTALAVVALVATAVAGAALAAVAAHSTATATATSIKVTETDYKVALSKSSVPVGSITFTVHNGSQTSHKFGVKGNGVSKTIVGLIKPGQTKTLTVTLAKGTYTVYCPLHISMGMKAALKVGTTSGGTTTTHTTTTSTTTHWS